MWATFFFAFVIGFLLWHLLTAIADDKVRRELEEGLYDRQAELRIHN